MIEEIPYPYSRVFFAEDYRESVKPCWPEYVLDGVDIVLNVGDFLYSAASNIANLKGAEVIANVSEVVVKGAGFLPRVISPVFQILMSLLKTFGSALEIIGQFVLAGMKIFGEGLLVFGKGFFQVLFVILQGLK